MSRPLIYLAAALLLLLLASTGWLAIQQHRSEKVVEQPAAAHAATVASETARQTRADSGLNRLAGRADEAHARTDSSTQTYEALRRLLPAAGLPAPVRYRPVR